ncbi:hypothetical protein Tco_0692006 [Tanacetum coccineum]
MTGGSSNDPMINPSLSTMLYKSVLIASKTIVGRDGRIHSYCGLKLADIPATGSGLKEKISSSTSRYAHTHASRRPQGVPSACHNLGPPSYKCAKCDATMWYAERTDKAQRAAHPTFSLCCQEGKLRLPQFNDTPPPLKKLLDYNDPTTSKFKEQIRVYNSVDPVLNRSLTP